MMNESQGEDILSAILCPLCLSVHIQYRHLRTCDRNSMLNLYYALIKSNLDAKSVFLIQYTCFSDKLQCTKQPLTGTLMVPLMSVHKCGLHLSQETYGPPLHTIARNKYWTNIEINE